MLNKRYFAYWTKALKNLEESVDESVYQSWFSSLKFVDIRPPKLILTAPSEAIKAKIISKYREDIIEAIQEYVFEVDELEVVVKEVEKPVKKLVKRPVGQPNKSEDKKVDSNDIHTVSKLDKRFTFDHFVVGQPNEFAYAAARKIAESDSPVYNPLFLYGGVGLGKTHLMHSIAWYKKTHQPEKRVIYISAERFMYLFLRSLRFKDSISFKELFREVDVLMIDDVQFIGGKESTQEEFFHTFNELVDANRQVVISADKSPNELEGIEEKLKSRLNGGLVADIHPTTYELRLNILKSKAKLFKIKIPLDVLEYLAVNIESNIRELEGALNRVVAHATLVERTLSIDMANEVLKDVLQSNEKFVTIKMIQNQVCEFYNIKLTDMLSAKRQQAVATARQVAMYLAKDLTGKSYPEIGKQFGGKDHSTVMHSVKKVQEKMEKDREIRSNIAILVKSLKKN